jgi:hypothetical protein
MMLGSPAGRTRRSGSLSTGPASHSTRGMSEWSKRSDLPMPTRSSSMRQRLLSAMRRSTSTLPRPGRVFPGSAR